MSTILYQIFIQKQIKIYLRGKFALSIWEVITNAHTIDAYGGPRRVSALGLDA
nr:MAG TPA: hypothetical protein [Caudoviricetes sp.]